MEGWYREEPLSSGCRMDSDRSSPGTGRRRASWHQDFPEPPCRSPSTPCWSPRAAGRRLHDLRAADEDAAGVRMRSSSSSPLLRAHRWHGSASRPGPGPNLLSLLDSASPAGSHSHLFGFEPGYEARYESRPPSRSGSLSGSLSLHSLPYELLRGADPAGDTCCFVFGSGTATCPGYSSGCGYLFASASASGLGYPSVPPPPAPESVSTTPPTPTPDSATDGEYGMAGDWQHYDGSGDVHGDMQRGQVYVEAPWGILRFQVSDLAWLFI